MERDESVVFLIKSFSNQIKRNMDGKLTGMQYGILDFIDNHKKEKDVFQKDIETEFNIRRSTATGILQLMEQRGLIIRESVSYDARLKKIMTTLHANVLKQEVINEFENLEKRIRANISPDELNLFMENIKKMIQNLEG